MVFEEFLRDLGNFVIPVQKMAKPLKFVEDH